MKKVGWARRAAIIAGGGGLALGLIGVQATRASAEPASNGSNSSVGNPYDPANGHPYRHGAVPTQEDNSQLKAYNASHNGGSNTAEILGYGGGVSNTDGSVVGVTSGTPKVYLVFWGSAWGTQGTDSNNNLTFSNDGDGGAPYIQNLFKGLGTAPSGGSQEMWSATMTQYCDGSVAFAATTCPTGAVHIGYPSSGGVLAGVWYDNSSEPTTTTATQIAQEAVNAAFHFGNTSVTSNRYAQYDILSPPGANPDSYKTGGFCAWHDYTGDSYGVSTSYGYLAFTNMPYVMDAGASCGMNFVNSGSAGTLDGYSIVNGHEYAETITDQFPAGGWTNLQNNSFAGEENGDECAWLSSGTGAAKDVSMSTGTFAMQSTWSNSNNGCILNTDSIVTGGTGTPPSPPATLGASVSGSSVILQWSASTGATSYDVLRSGPNTSGSFTQIGTSTTTGYTDSPPVTGTWYYEVEAVGSGGTSGPSPSASASVTVTLQSMTVTVAAGSVSRTRRGYSVPLTVTAQSSGSGVGSASVVMNVYANSTCTGTAVASGNGTTNSSGQVGFTFTTKSATTYCAAATVSKNGYSTTTGDSAPFTT